MYADLHLHSACSDGRLTPSELIDSVCDAGVGVAALTDHDTTSGLEAAALRARQRGLTFISGIELTTYAHDRVVHLLGFGLDATNAELQTANEDAQAVWACNQHRWVAALAAEGHDLAYAREFSDGPVRLPVLIERLCRTGVAGGDPAACLTLFRTFFSQLPAEAYAGLPAPAQAAAIVRRAGGQAILAHPFSVGNIDAVREILPHCDGLEALYARYDAQQRQGLLQLARETGKLYSCGSDYHGYFVEDYVNPRFELPAMLALRIGVGQG